MNVYINSQSLQELKNKNNNRRNSPRENIQLVCWQECLGHGMDVHLTLISPTKWD